MSKESLQKNVDIIEMKNKSEVISVGQNKNDQKFANEILNKIEEDFKLSLDNKDKVKLKISEITGLNNKTQLELSEFSKRYSAFFRSLLAERIRNLRYQYEIKHKEKPAEIEALKSSIENEKVTIGEIKNEKISEEKLRDDLEAQKTKIDVEIRELKDGLNERKNSFFYKIKQKFILNKNEITEDLVGFFESEGLKKENIKNKLYHKDFDMVQTIKSKKDIFENIDISLEEKQKEIKKKNELLARLMDSIEDKYETINEVEEIINSDFEIKEIEKIVSDFYNEVLIYKKQIEAEKKERSVAEISKEKNVLFCHAMPMQIIPDTNFSQNNQLINTRRFGSEEKLKIILGIEPTISVSTLNEGSQKLVNGFGMILNGGQVLSAYAGDAGTLLNKNIYDRRSKHDPTLKTSIIQLDIKDNLDHAINHTPRREPISGDIVEDPSQGWNEIVVENPKVAGLYFQSDQTDSSYNNSLDYAIKISKDLNLPLYLLEEDKIYQKDKDNNFIEVNKEDILNSNKNFLPYERKNLIEELIDKEVFSIKKENIYSFNGYNAGKGYYKFIKRIDAGEKVSIERLHENELIEEGDELIPFVDHSYAIKIIKLNEKQWELFGRENWEKYKKYLKEDGSFDAKFHGSSVWEPHFFVEFPREEMEDSISSYIEMAGKEIERLLFITKQARLENENLGDFPVRKKSVIYILYGVMEECQKNRDNKNYEKAKQIIEKYGSIEECENFIQKRVGENGGFKYLEEDVPIEVRKKLKN